MALRQFGASAFAEGNNPFRAFKIEFWNRVENALLRWCGDAGIRELDAATEAWEFSDDSGGAGLFRFLTERWAPFVVTDFLVRQSR